MLQLHWNDKNGKGCWMDQFSTSAPYATRDKARLEKRIRSLHRQRIDATLYDENREIVGEVDANLRNWWYDPSVFPAVAPV
jgi:hypothetical protein